MKIIITAFLGFVLFQSALFAQTKAGEQYQLATKAYEKENYIDFLSHLEKANELRPNHRTILYNLAVAYTLNNKIKSAVDILNYRASFYAVNDFAEDEDFLPLKEIPEYKELLLSIEASNMPVLNSSLNFEFDQQGFHPEGIVVDPSTQNFLISDVRSGLINSFDPNGADKKEANG